LLLCCVSSLAACGAETTDDDASGKDPAESIYPHDEATWSSSGSTNFHGNVVNRAGLSPCLECHGADLTGSGDASSCDQCHSGWQTDCTFCHGDRATDRANPPRDLNGETATTARGVGAHASHVAGRLAIARDFTCDVCHTMPDSALSLGHVDGDPAAVVFNHASYPAASGWDAQTGTCSVYCHGAFEGGDRDNAPVWTTVGEGEAACGTCHSLEPSTGHHRDHIYDAGYDCSVCHPSATGNAITDANAHINGHVDVGNSITSWDGSRCSSCHDGERTW
jgi:hypothetical protein